MNTFCYTTGRQETNMVARTIYTALSTWEDGQEEGLVTGGEVFLIGSEK